MASFRKKPVVIEAFKLGEQEPEWWTDALRAGVAEVYPDHATIETLEGTHRAEIGDWIIQGVKGELYPCKPDIFTLTYDPVQEA